MKWYVYNFRGVFQQVFDTAEEADAFIDKQTIPSEYYKDRHP